ncbi:predicted protein [Histoplasma mississippiense (nom. inval.)]|uniref:predicted protein n=1 Tax=Ajellomyces capsulatus (strain NAm1 / WU24) TaxID=2059318 RepID=UPI000157B62E|nr:predicted protein [Histoplasma mississippiense (nom. inval.)]EDN02447.1 predicted protein [Histoplasma mississippiense (nom. inval.)]
MSGKALKHANEAKEFFSFCPPDVQPNTHGITLCGINDFEDNASPKQDGWFLSDFFLFHHLLQNTHKHSSLKRVIIHSTRQINCGSPALNHELL